MAGMGKENHKPDAGTWYRSLGEGGAEAAGRGRKANTERQVICLVEGAAREGQGCHKSLGAGLQGALEAEGKVQWHQRWSHGKLDGGGEGSSLSLC
jgi:hypothetical protein